MVVFCNHAEHEEGSAPNRENPRMEIVDVLTAAFGLYSLQSEQDINGVLLSYPELWDPIEVDQFNHRRHCSDIKDLAWMIRPGYELFQNPYSAAIRKVFSVDLCWTRVCEDGYWMDRAALCQKYPALEDQRIVFGFPVMSTLDYDPIAALCPGCMGIETVMENELLLQVRSHSAQCSSLLIRDTATLLCPRPHERTAGA